MGELEARLRSDVGPQYGFDLQQIGKHYEHRRRIRSRFSVLREGQLAVLTARHRFGEHGHVLAYARYAPGQVAVVAANFNGHPSTFATDCSAVTAAFGASTAAEASASVAELMEASAAVGEALSARIGGASAAPSSSSAPALPASKGVAGSSPGGVLALSMPLPSLNLRGGVWEVRDIFASSAAGYSDEAFVPTAYNASDGPLVGIVTSEEAAYAPILATLPPHRSHCWLYCAASGSKGAAGSASAATPAGAASGERLAETDPAAMQWLFASSLLRLQSVLRLKESGLASSVITLPEVEAAGGYAALLAQRREGREGGGGAGGGHGWIAPGEALKDEEIMAAARHNLVYSLLRHVVKRTYRSMAGARSVGVGAAAGAGGSPRPSGGLASIPSDKQRAIVRECAGLLDAAFRVLVTHLQLRREQDAGVEGIAAGLAAGGLEGLESASGRAPPSLVGAPLPSLHGAMNRGAGVEATPSAAAAAGDPAWFAIDASAAVSVLRAALFLAVKDVVAQVAGALPSADVSDEDAALSAVLVRSLTSVAAGRTAAGQAARPGAAESLGAGPAASTALIAVSASDAAPSALLSRERAVLSLAGRLLWSNTVSPIVFITPELGKWSTVGGLGVMVDELSIGLAELGAEVVCISPYYNVNRKGVGDYLRSDGILYTGRNVAVWVGDEKIEMGVHEGRVKGVRVFFLHNATVFPKPYPTLDAHGQVRVLSAFAKGCLELLCQWREIPSLVVTNDWFTGLVPAYARHGHFGDVFNRTDFMHIAHNLDADYEGRLYPDPGQGTLSHLHGLPSHLLVDPHWSAVVVNPSRAALLCTDTWATVSRSYRQDLLGSSALAPLLRLSPHPFAHPNGIPVKARLARLASLPHPTHAAAKAALQRKYFGFEAADESMPLFAFVGRITMQKGVHLILQSVEEILRATGGRAMFLVGGMASASDTYGNNCAGRMRELHHRYPDRFWANPDLFFTDGDLVNLGADFCLMPSMFEPGGIVQQEFFVAGTPVIAYKTGGLKDTVFEFESSGAKCSGNGFTFEGYQARDFVFACQRAIAVYSKPAEYARLRANARASVMDLEVVSKAWFREFHRLRRALPPPPVRTSDEHVVEFAIRTGAVPGLTTDSTVAITGSFFSE
jgi:glycogen synthase